MKFTGMPVKGKGRGKTLGYPTINLHRLTWVDIDEGVYAAKAIIRGVAYKAALHCGSAPTFRDREKTVELFLLDTPSITVLGTEKIAVETCEYLRPIKKFASKKELIEQITKDVARTNSLITLN